MSKKRIRYEFCKGEGCRTVLEKDLGKKNAYKRRYCEVCHRLIQKKRDRDLKRSKRYEFDQENIIEEGIDPEDIYE